MVDLLLMLAAAASLFLARYLRVDRRHFARSLASRAARFSRMRSALLSFVVGTTIVADRITGSSTAVLCAREPSPGICLVFLPWGLKQN